MEIPVLTLKKSPDTPPESGMERRRLTRVTQTGMRADELRRYSPWQTIEQSQQGLLPHQVQTVSRALGLSVKELAELLNVSETTLHRKTGSKAQAAPPHMVEHLMLLESLAKTGYSVYEQEPVAFLRWLNHPQWHLQDRTPLSLLGTTTGIGIVERLLGRIEYGEFA